MSGVVLMVDGREQITVPYIQGDGIGPDIMAAARRVIDAALESATDGATHIRWAEILAGERSFKQTG